MVGEREGEMGGGRGGEWVTGVRGGGLGARPNGGKRERGQDQSEMEGEPVEKEMKICGEGGISYHQDGRKNNTGNGERDSEEDSVESPGWIREVMEGLEERGQGRLWHDEEEGRRFWGGGGEALRRKREREWETEGWEEWNMVEEERGAAPSEEEHVEGNVVMDKVGEMMEGKRGEVGDGSENDGGGDGGREAEVTLHKGRPTSKRKPLRGRRRGKKNGLGEGEREKMALLLTKWMGTNPHRVKKD